MMETLHVTGSTFEGLYVRALEPRGEFLRELVEAGFDPKNVQPQYPLAVWHRAMEIAARHHFPKLSREEAERALGRIFLQGFLSTLPGSAIGGALAMIGPARMLERMAHYMVFSRDDVEVRVEKLSACDFRLSLVDAFPRPHFVCGCVEHALERARTEGGTVVVESQSPTGYTLRVKW